MTTFGEILLLRGISIHSPRVGRDVDSCYFGESKREISIHSPRVGRDALAERCRYRLILFQSTRPAWGETDRRWSEEAEIIEFQSTRPAWGETRTRSGRSASFRNFNPLAPRGARQGNAVEIRVLALDFNPLAPRGARPSTAISIPPVMDFNPLAPRGARRAGDWRKRDHPGISIHSPRVGRDLVGGGNDAGKSAFQSTRPAWGETLREAALS